MKIAVLGGGGLGSCTALELAANGHQVDLFEQDSEPVMRASRVNEGKIHLGFIYANDATRRTADTMVAGALRFEPLLSRWVDLTADPLQLSTPFVYAVHRDTMVGVEELEAHFAHCAAAANATGGRYLGREEPTAYRRMAEGEIEAILDPRYFLTAFQTTELSVNPRHVAALIRRAVLAAPRVTYVGGGRVKAVSERNTGGYDIAYDQGGAQTAGPYDQVVNALWESRMAIDATMGITPPRQWIFRHKFGNRLNVPVTPDAAPSVTTVLGPFGDVVNFGEHGLYVSWYPLGMVATCHDLSPPADWTDLADDERRAVFARSFEAWQAYCPKLRDIAFPPEAVDPTSGVIFAWGETDIDDPSSELHNRYEVGVWSRGGYHSVDAGKFTLIPAMAMKAAGRVMGQEA